MLIWRPDDDGRVTYYKTFDGTRRRGITTPSRDQAGRLEPEIAARVLEQLKQVDDRGWRLER